MDIKALTESLPDHWKVINVGDSDDHNSDDGRDYDKPMFVRKDGLARIYFNDGEDESTGYLFAIAYDEDGDGDCYGSFNVAIREAEAYVAKHHPTSER